MSKTTRGKDWFESTEAIFGREDFSSQEMLQDLGVFVGRTAEQNRVWKKIDGGQVSLVGGFNPSEKY